MLKTLKCFLSISKNSSIKKHSKIIIIGGGDSGSALSNLLIENPKINIHDIAIIDPSLIYTYQSAQTMVGAGLFNNRTIQRPLIKRLPRGIDFINKSVIKINAEENYVETENSKISYEYLVIGTGINPKLELIKGLKESLEDPDIPVGTNYILEYAKKMNSLRENFKGGNAIFTQPLSPIKCGGAPQKILYLSTEFWKNKKLDFKSDFYLGTPTIFGNAYYAEALLKVANSYNIGLHYQHELVEVRGKERIAVFKNLKTNENIEKNFDILHATPLQKPADFLLKSNIVNANGFVNVDIHTLQHKVFPNIFALGDCADLPTSKTLSSVNDQVHVVNKNLNFEITKLGTKLYYEGYTACPIFVGNKKIMLCEFGYDGKLLPTFSKNQNIPRRFFYFLKMFVFDKFGLYLGTDKIRFFRKLCNFSIFKKE